MKGRDELIKLSQKTRLLWITLVFWAALARAEDLALTCPEDGFTQDIEAELTCTLDADKLGADEACKDATEIKLQLINGKLELTSKYPDCELEWTDGSKCNSGSGATGSYIYMFKVTVDEEAIKVKDTAFFRCKPSPCLEDKETKLSFVDCGPPLQIKTNETDDNPGGPHSDNTLLVVGVSVAAAIVVLGIGVVIFLIIRRRKAQEKAKVEEARRASRRWSVLNIVRKASIAAPKKDQPEGKKSTTESVSAAASQVSNVVSSAASSAASSTGGASSSAASSTTGDSTAGSEAGSEAN